MASSSPPRYCTRKKNVISRINKSPLKSKKYIFVCATHCNPWSWRAMPSHPVFYNMAVQPKSTFRKRISIPAKFRSQRRIRGSQFDLYQNLNQWRPSQDHPSAPILSQYCLPVLAVKTSRSSTAQMPFCSFSISIKNLIVCQAQNNGDLYC